MKLIYTILFFLDLVILVTLSFLFLQLLDNKADGIQLGETLSGIVICLLLLAFFLFRYVKLISRKD